MQSEIPAYGPTPGKKVQYEPLKQDTRQMPALSDN
jgi:hypothetical protein